MGGIERGKPAGRLAVAGEVTAGGEIVFDEVDRDGHVQHVAQRAIAIGRAGDLRNVAGDERIGIEQPAPDEDAREGRGDGFADGKDDMPALEREPVVIALGDDASALEHHEAIGEGLGEQASDDPLGPRVSNPIQTARPARVGLSWKHRIHQWQIGRELRRSCGLGL